ncbi:RNI-like protein [Basidiobolus meristosporus CBS 931.73]|uniref:RNI-like protein n=1 Tax=Basidiobolus meristosporus CBS 931.73 TaxID=1314790 RepID=A0A1Y1YT57_9FUNG|nr:RNI-like protein [Basidiobolus meristosporus CBS 931.73]|eukprot:ORY00755.1 RNI-like protein [Basidiobolus meristosporus CBS 931.73]
MNTVAVNSKVARCVRELDLERYKGNLLSLHLIERLIKFLPYLHTLSILSFDNYMQRRPSSSFLSSLFFTFPSLKRLTFTATTCDHSLIVDIGYVIKQCPYLEELKLLMNFNPSNHICQKPKFNEETLGLFEEIGPLKHLKSLEIAGPFVENFLFSLLLPRIPNLTKLTVAGGVFTAKYIEQISDACPNITSLNFIRFDDTLKLFDQICLDIARYFPKQLTELSISLSTVRDASSALWKSLGKSVTSISLYNTKLTNADIKSLAEHIGSSLHTLRLQNVMHNQKPGIRAWTAILCRCGSSLKVLDISRNNLMNDRIGHLVARHCRSLYSLSIAKTKISKESIEPMVCSNRSGLKYLNLSGVRLNEQIVHMVATHCKNLRNLRLQTFSTMMDDTNLCPLLKGIGGQLQFLDLRGRIMNSKLCKEVARNCPNLRAISFCNNSKLRDEDVLSLLLLRPNLQIINLHCQKCFFVKGGLSGSLISQIREHGIYGDTWWYQESDRDYIAPYHKLAGMLD